MRTIFVSLALLSLNGKILAGPLTKNLPGLSKSTKTDCENFQGRWEGSCTFSTQGHDSTYRSTLIIAQEECASISLRDADSLEAQEYQAGKSNISISFPEGTFLNVTAYVDWIENSRTVSVKEYLNYEGIFEGSKINNAVTKVSRISPAGPQALTFTIHEEAMNPINPASHTSCQLKLIAR